MKPHQDESCTCVKINFYSFKESNHRELFLFSISLYWKKNRVILAERLLGWAGHEERVRVAIRGLTEMAKNLV